MYWLHKLIPRWSLSTKAMLFVVFACLGMLSLDIRQIWTAHDADLQGAQVETRNLARSLAQHAQDVFENTDAILKGLREGVAYDGTGPDAIQRLEYRMRARVQNQPLLQRLSIFDDHGAWLASSLDLATFNRVRAVTYSDRAYFRFHRDHAEDVAYVGPPIRQKSDNALVMTLSRRLGNPDGSFAGVVNATIALDLFQHFFATFDIGKRGAITLATNEGTLVVRRPFVEANIGRKISESDFFRQITPDAISGSFEFISFFDGTPRLGSFHRVPGFNLIMMVALDQNEVLAEWRDQTRVHLIWLTATLLLVALLGYRLARQIRARGRAEARLALSQETLERRVVARTEDLQKTVAQRDRILREVYHRVKNNLQLVDSLIDMESRKLGDADMKQGLADLRSRVFALALVHQQLMSSDNFYTFPMAPFLKELCQNVADSTGAADRGIAVSVKADPVTVNLDFAIPIGLLATELLNNALRHAGTMEVTVDFRCCDSERAMLVVSDDGHTAETEDKRLSIQGSFGSKLIAGFTRQLDGRIKVLNQHGTRIEIHMPLPQVA